MKPVNVGERNAEFQLIVPPKLFTGGEESAPSTPRSHL
jgi:hypothetical protein